MHVHFQTDIYLTYPYICKPLSTNLAHKEKKNKHPKMIFLQNLPVSSLHITSPLSLASLLIFNLTLQLLQDFLSRPQVGFQTIHLLAHRL